MCHRSIFRAALLLATVGTSAAGQTPRPPDRIAFTRLNTDDLEIGEAGVLVIRDSASWIRLWTYFGREYRTDWSAPIPDRVATPPTVDFARYMIVAVGYGARSGCGNRAIYINRLESAKRRIRVVLGPDEPPRPELTCMMIINPVDAVVVERDSRRLTFVAARAGYPIPPRAQWLTPPSVDAALDTGRSVRKQVAWRVLPRDSTRPFNDLRRLARAASAGIGPGLDLLANARVRQSPELLTIFGTGPHALPLAREYLFQLHADRVATDPASDTAAFRIILEKLQGDEHPDIARSLVDNRALRKNSLLLRELIRKVWRDSVTCHAAARVYLSHWPSPSDYYMSSPCQPPSDLTRLRRPNVRVDYVCGNTFRVRNELATAVIVAWDTDSSDSGSQLLPSRGHRAYSEAYVTTATRGWFHLYRDGRMFAMVGNPGGRRCQPGDTTPPSVPIARILVPEDTGLLVSSDSGTRYYRNLVSVQFYDTTGGDQVRGVLARWRATIVAGGPDPSAYILRRPAPGPGATRNGLDSLLAALREEPGVQDAFPIALREPAHLH